MTTKARVEVFKTDDWIDIFVNEKQVHGGHSISPSSLLELVKDVGPFDLRSSYWTYDPDDLIGEGRPLRLCDLLGYFKD